MLHFNPATWPLCPPRRWQKEAFDAVVEHLGFMAAEPAVVSAIMGAGKSLLVGELCAAVRLRATEVVVVSTSTEHLVEDLSASIARRCRMVRSVGTWYGRRKRLGAVIVACTPSVPALADRLHQKGLSVALWIADEAHRTECGTILGAQLALAPEHTLGVTATPFRADRWETMSLFKKLVYRYGVAAAQADGVVVPWRIVHSPEGGDLDAACVGLVREARGPGVANAVDIADAEAFAETLKAAGIPARAVHSKQPPWRRRRVLADLEAGRIACAVHVNLLAEGVDFPWLRWALLRRQVESRVRFMQEVGRLLRSHPGKTEAVFMDVHDLFGQFHLSYAEALGEPPEKPEWEGEVNPAVVAGHIESEGDPAIALAWIESVLRSLTVACDTAGLLRDRRIIPKAERVKPSTPLQRAALAGEIAATRELIPENWLRCLAAVAARPDSLRYGFAADLLMVLASVRSSRRWPPIDSEGRISASLDTENSRPFPMLIPVRGGQTKIDVSVLVEAQ